MRVWYVRQGDAWVKAAEVMSAAVETDSSERQDESCPPGTIWQRAIELLLPGDTRLLCRTTTPITERLEPMDYLRRGKLGMNRHTHESTHRVVGNYRLERVDA